MDALEKLGFKKSQHDSGKIIYHRENPLDTVYLGKDFCDSDYGFNYEIILALAEIIKGGNKMNKQALLNTLDILIDIAKQSHSNAYSTDKYFYAGGISALQEVRKIIEETKDE